jgi:predicted nucleic acid-binding protein
VILVDTSVWVEHLRTGHATLVALLETGAVLGHPWVTGELALGHLSQRQEIVRLLRSLPKAAVPTDDETMTFIDRHRLYGLGIGYVDTHLLAATCLTADAALWTTDRRLAAAAWGLGCAIDPEARHPGRRA